MLITYVTPFSRLGFLGCLSRESSCVRLFDLQYAGRDLLEPSVFVRSVAEDASSSVSSFSWHPSLYNTVLTAASTG